MVRRRDSTPKCRYVKYSASESYLILHTLVLEILDTFLMPCIIWQVVRMRLEEGRRIVGTLIPGTAMEQLIKTLGQGAEEAEETIH